MTVQEFEERLFDVLNESDELPIDDLRIFSRDGGLTVTVGDGSRFVLKCFSAIRPVEKKDRI